MQYGTFKPVKYIFSYKLKFLANLFGFTCVQGGATPRVVAFEVDFRGKSGKLPIKLQFSVLISEWYTGIFGKFVVKK